MNRILSGAEVQRFAEVTAQLGPWAMPVVEAIRCGAIALQMLTRGDRAPLGDMRRAPLPLLTWIGDDDEASCGPDGWRAAIPATFWARGAIVHAAAGEAIHYAAAVAMTVQTGRGLLIETSSRHAAAWAALLPGKPTLIIAPRDGKPHPVGDRETRH